MRTTQKRVKELHSELGKGIGAKNMDEIQAHLVKARKYFTKKLEAAGFSGVQLSAYRGNAWSLSALTHGATHETFYFETDRLLDEPFSLAKEFVQKAEKP